jgi:predicted nucleic acid-binding protein
MAWRPWNQSGITDNTVIVCRSRHVSSCGGAPIQAGRQLSDPPSHPGRDIQIAVSVALVLEYESVLLRPSLVPRFTHKEIGRIVDGLCILANHQQVFFAWRPFLPDPDDDLLLELVIAASASFIITHNTADFRGSDSMGVRAITPAKTLELIRR